MVEASLPDAYAQCEQLARDHYENFPVASRLLPARMRPHIAAIYAFARTADDFADEPGMADDERLRLLDEWSFRLKNGDTQLFRFSASTEKLSVPVFRPSTFPEKLSVPIFQALHDTIATHNLPVQLFEDLLSAFRQDVTKHRYQTWADVLDYSRRSANPVGRLVLRVAGYNDPALDRASDAVCTALQLTNFWQDLDRDWRNGRLYVPLDDRDRHGARDEDLTARRMTPQWRSALADVTLRTRELFDAGRPVCDGVSGRLRWELRLTWLGGCRILDKLERAQFDVFHKRPTIGAADLPGLIWKAATWREQ